MGTNPIGKPVCVRVAVTWPQYHRGGTEARTGTLLRGELEGVSISGIEGLGILQ